VDLLLKDLKREIIDLVEHHRKELISMSDWLKANPEIGHQEYLASWLLSSFLEKDGMDVERGVAGLETAFRSVSRGRRDKPVVALMAEYDALPEIGHGCGHNIIATSAIGAAVALNKIMPRIDGTLVVLGCPAEEDYVENAGGKIIMVEKGVFDEIDCAMMVHPSPDVSYMKRSSSMARVGLRISFVRYPLSQPRMVSDAVTALSSHIEHLNKDMTLRIIIEKITRLPDHVDISMKVDAPDVPTVLELSRNLTLEANRIATKSGVLMFQRYFTKTYSNMIWNSALSDAFKANLNELGEHTISDIDRPNVGDESNVSLVVPTICTWIRISDRPLPNHSREFADSTVSDFAHEAIMLGAKALAMTALDIFTNAELVKKARHEFAQVVKP
jgi:amidohydrolase